MSLRNYILDYTFDYFDLIDLVKLIRLSKRLFKIIKSKKQIKEWLNKLFITTKYESLIIFDRSFNKVNEIYANQSTVNCLTKIDDNHIASGGFAIIKIWNIRTGECIKTLKDNFTQIYGLTVLQNKFLVSGFAGGEVRIWDREYNCIKILEENTSTTKQFFTMHNGWLVCGSMNAQIKVYDPHNDYKCIYTLEENKDAVDRIRQNANNDLITISYVFPCSIILWGFNQQFKKVKEVDVKGDLGYLLTILPNNRIATGHFCLRIRIWDASTLDYLYHLNSGQWNKICTLTLLSNGYLFSAGCDKDVVIWKISNENGKYIKYRTIENVLNEYMIEV